MDMVFDSNDIEMISKFIEQRNVEYNKLQRAIADNYLTMATLVQSEDSNLAQTYQKVTDTLINIGEKINKLCIDLVAALDKYAQQTLANEAEIFKGINDLNNQMEDINSLLDSLAAAGPVQPTRPVTGTTGIPV